MPKVKEVLEILSKQPSDNNVLLVDKDQHVVRHFEIKSNGSGLTIFMEAEYKLHDKGF